MGGRTKRIDAHVGERIRLRRTELGLTQEQLAAALDVSYQQIQNYETGANRVSAGRILEIARKLGVDVGYFFEGIHGGEQSFKATPQQRMLLELARNFISIPTRKHQEAICSLARALNTDTSDS